MHEDGLTTPSPPPPSEPPPVLPPPLPARPQKEESTEINLENVSEKPSVSVSAKPLPKKSLLEHPLEAEDDEISQHMTQSYSEISFKSASPENESIPTLDLDSVEVSEHYINRPQTLACEKSTPLIRPLNLDGTVHKEGNMTHFVAEEIEHKIKLSSPVSKNTPSGSRSGTPNSLYRQLLGPQVNQLDTALINDLEVEAQRLATSVDNLVENLSGILHSISSITADNVEVYKNAVSKMSDAMDGNIKSMYTIMAKAEEVSQNMKVVEGLSVKIKEIKKLVDLFESFV